MKAASGSSASRRSSRPSCRTNTRTSGAPWALPVRGARRGVRAGAAGQRHGRSEAYRRILRVVQRLRRFFDIRAGEGTAVALVFLYIATVVASYLLAKPIRNGLFLKEYGAYKLVYVYAGVPPCSRLSWPYTPGLPPTWAPAAWSSSRCGSSAPNVVLFWYAFRFATFPGLPAIFYIWVNCFGIIAPVQAWAFAGAVFDYAPGQAALRPHRERRLARRHRRRGPRDRARRADRQRSTCSSSSRS